MTANGTLLRALVEMHPDDAAHYMESWETAAISDLVSELPNDLATRVIERMSPQIVAPALAALSAERVQHLLTTIDLRSAAVIMLQFDAPQRDSILRNMPATQRKPLEELTGYEPHSVGSMMEPRVATLSFQLTASQAVAIVRKSPREILHYLYVADKDGKLVGVANMRDLLLAGDDQPLAEILNRNVISVEDTMDRDEAIQLLTEHRLLAIPVVDFEGRLLGVVKHDTALKSSQLAGFEDLQKIAGTAGTEKALSSVATVVKSRLPWLIVNLITAFMAAAVVGLFEGTIAQVAALAVLMPVVAGQGGNTGAQSLAIVIRGIAIREIVTGAEGRVIKKELLASVVNSCVIAMLTAALVFGWQLWLQDAGVTRSLALSIVIFLSMIVNMVAAALAGTIIPLLLKSMGRDPAQSSSIFLTTVTDIIGFGSFLGFAVLLLPSLV